MKKLKMLVFILIPMCVIFMSAEISSIKAGAVTVDIKDNYDTGLIEEESDSKKVDYTMEGSAADAASSTSSSSSSSASSGSSARPAAASSTASSAANTASTAANAASSVSTVTPATQTTTDLPRTGDDDRIILTFIAMLFSFSIFLTALLARGRISRK